MASFSYKIGGGGLIFLQNWRRRPHFPIKLAAAASFSYKIGGGGKVLATLLAAVLTWSGYWISFPDSYWAFLWIISDFNLAKKSNKCLAKFFNYHSSVTNLQRSNSLFL